MPLKILSNNQAFIFTHNLKGKNSAHGSNVDAVILEDMLCGTWLVYMQSDVMRLRRGPVTRKGSESVREGD